MGLWFKLDIRGDSNNSLFITQCQQRDLPKKLTIDTVDTYRYLDFYFYGKSCFKYNGVIYSSEHGRWLGIPHCKWRLTCYNIITHTRKLIFRSTVQRLNKLELYTDEVKETYENFDEGIC